MNLIRKICSHYTKPSELYVFELEDGSPEFYTIGSPPPSLFWENYLGGDEHKSYPYNYRKVSQDFLGIWREEDIWWSKYTPLKEYLGDSHESL